MREPLAALLLALALLPAAPALSASGQPSVGPDESPVGASLSLSSASVGPGGSVRATLSLSHRPGWHSYGPDEQDVGIPTSVEWRLPPGFSAGSLSWPKPERFQDRGVSALGYSGVVELHATLSAGADIGPGPFRIEAEVSWLACADSCVPGKALLSAGLAAAPAPPPKSAAGLVPLLLALLGAFVGGLLLNLMPCVLPVIALKLRGFISSAGSSRRVSLGNGLAYAAGVILSLEALAALLLALRSGGAALGWGFQFQAPGFAAFLSLLFLFLGLESLGVFGFGEGVAGKAAAADRGEGPLRAFLAGLLAVLASTPCAAPLMGAALGWALSAPAGAALAVFASLGLGLALPLLLLSAFPSLASRLPRAGAWTRVVQDLLGLCLLGTSAWLVTVNASVSGPASLGPLLASFLAAGASALLLGRWAGPDRPRASRNAARAVAGLLLLAALALALLSGRALPASRPSQEPPAPASPASASPWKPYSPETLEAALGSGQAVLIDFTADWCLSCKANEAAVLSRPSVASALSSAGVLPLRADWTRGDPEVTRALEGYGRHSVPLYVLYREGSRSPLLLPEILTEGILLDALADR